MRTVITSKGKMLLPAELREEDDIRAGEVFEITRVKRTEYRLRRKVKRPNEGLVDLLLACPVKGFFQPARSGQTTDSIQPELK